MAETLKPKQRLNNGRYTITKVHSTGEHSTVYLAQDKENKGSTCIIREIYVSADLSAEEKSKLDERFQNSLLILTSFDHPHLANIYDSFIGENTYYVVMEYIDGITLTKLLSMSVNPLPEKQVIDWSLQVCSAMQYMHNRPKPFIFDALGSNHVMIDQNENIRLIDFGLSRINDENSVSFSTNPAMINLEIKEFARTLVFLLTRKDASEFGLNSDIELSEPLTKLLEKLLANDSDNMDFDKLARELENVKNPPKIVAKKVDKAKPDFKLINFNKLGSDLIEKFMAQRVWVIACEFLALIGVVLGLYLMFHPQIKERAQAAMYVSCGNELYMYSAINKEPLGRARLGYQINNLTPSRDGIKLYCSLADSSRIAVFNAQSNRLIGTFQVGSGPTLMVLDSLEQWLYVLQGHDGLVTAVQVDHAPLPSVASQQSIKEKALGMYSVGRDSSGLTIFKSPHKVKEGKKAVNKGHDEVVICTSALDNVVDTFVNPPMAGVVSQYCKSAGPVSVTRDGSMAVVGQTSTSKLEFFRTETLASLGHATQTGGAELRQVLYSPDCKSVYCLNGSGNVGVVDATSHKLTSTIKMAGHPVDADWNFASGKPELWVATVNPNQLVVIDPTTKTVTQNIDIGGTPKDICFINAPKGTKK